jgi:hypothetical protein
MVESIPPYVYRIEIPLFAQYDLLQVSCTSKSEHQPVQEA